MKPSLPKTIVIVGGVAGGASAAARARRLCEDCEIIVVLKSGQRLPADSVILGLGVKPEVGLATEAGLEIGKLGGIRVNEHLQTNDAHIWAVGDAIEVRDGVTGQWALIALAGPANRQGRIAADNIFGRPSRYEHTWGTAIVRLFKLTAGCAGANEKSLRRAAIPFQAIHLHPGSHAGYYPGAEPIALKILFAPATGKLLGAQAIGHDGVDKRIDVLATVRYDETRLEVADIKSAVRQSGYESPGESPPTPKAGSASASTPAPAAPKPSPAAPAATPPPTSAAPKPAAAAEPAPAAPAGDGKMDKPAPSTPAAAAPKPLPDAPVAAPGATSAGTKPEAKS